MKIFYLFISLSLIYINILKTSAQNLYHSKNVNNISISYGINHRAPIGVNIAYSNWLSKTVNIGAGFNFEKGRIGYSKFEEYLIYPEIKYSPKFSVRGKLFFNFGGAIFLGIQNAYSKEYPTIQNFTKFNYGLWLLGELEYYPIKRFGLTTQFRQAYSVPNKVLGHWHYSVNLGFRYVFY